MAKWQVRYCAVISDGKMASRLLCCNIGWQNGKSAVCSAELMTGGRVLVFLHAARTNQMTVRGREMQCIYTRERINTNMICVSCQSNTRTGEQTTEETRGMEGRGKG